MYRAPCRPRVELQLKHFRLFPPVKVMLIQDFKKKKDQKIIIVGLSYINSVEINR